MTHNGTWPEGISHESKADGADARPYDLYTAVEAGNGADMLAAEARRKHLRMRDSGTRSK